MASLLPDYKYDIFISYRQKDNKYDGWVTEFVESLKRELEATFKEEISVYFDINPHDGLLETHDVDASLREKLKCLILIPIISQTYCDLKSFAWQHEFVAFNKMAKEDRFGRDITLESGNIASRILPVKIHELDAEDRNVFEDETGGVLRAIEFIYKEPGVNRSLRPDDDVNENRNRTKYRNQLNKVANALKEIITGIKKYNKLEGNISKEVSKAKPERSKNLNEKSIIVLPFVNLSFDPGQEYLSDSLTEEIITNLSHINDLLVISRSSSMTFKGASTKIKEITDKVNVRYVLEGSVIKTGNNLRINVKLIDGMTGIQIWAEKDEGTMENVSHVHEKISGLIINSLKIRLTEPEKEKLIDHSESDLIAMECWLRAQQEIHLNTPYSFSRANAILEDGLRECGENELLYWSLGYINWFYVNIGTDTDDGYLQKAEHYVEKILNLNKDSFRGFRLQALIAYKLGDIKKSISNTRSALEIEPNNPEALNHIIFMYADTGKAHKSYKLIERLLSVDPLTSNNHWVKGWTLLTDGKIEESIPSFYRAHELDPKNVLWKILYAYSLLMAKQVEKAIEVITPLEDNPSDNIFVNFIFFVKNAFLKDHIKTLRSLQDGFFKIAERDEWCSLCLAQSFALINEYEKALYWIEYTVSRGFINYPFLSEYDHTLENIRGEEQFKNLMKRVKHEWEKFEV